MKTFKKKNLEIIFIQVPSYNVENIEYRMWHIKNRLLGLCIKTGRSDYHSVLSAITTLV